MATLTDQFGHKQPGELIKSKDWNGLIEAIDKLGDTLTAEITDLKNSLEPRVKTLEDEAKQLRIDVDAAKAEVDVLLPLIATLNRVVFTETRTLYAVGELAELIVTVTDLKGKPVTTMPMVHFVTPWGFLRPAPGFTSVGGEGDRSISVKCSDAGEARVFLRSEHAQYLTAQTEDDVAAMLTTKLDANRTISQAIVQAATPMEAKNAGAFPKITAEYDRADSTSVRSYVDTYYLKNTSIGVNRVGKSVLPGWRDFQSIWTEYHTVVMAFVGPEGADTSASGAAALAVTFRDWIYHWINLDYLDGVKERLPIISARLSPKVTQNYTETVGLLRDEVNLMVADKGLLGKHREYEAVHQVLGTLQPPNPPVFLNDLAKSMQNAVRVQQTLETVQVASGNAPGQAIAFEAFSDSASRSQSAGSEVAGTVTQLQQRLTQVETHTGNLTQQLTSLNTNVGTLGGKLDATLAEGGIVHTLQNSVKTVAQQVGAFQGFDPVATQQRLGDVNNIDARVKLLEKNLHV
jgi:chaperonin cofactor prefoldin